MPKVSIIVPIYNVEKYLDRCMQSLINQTLEDIEIIMVNDGSPDKCPEMCDNYAKKDSRIKVIHKQNAGLGYARNSGLKIALGEYIAFVDSDDYIDLNMYETLYQYASLKNLDVIYCGFRKEFEPNKYLNISECNSYTEYIGDTIKKIIPDFIASPPHMRQEYIHDMSVWHSIYRKDIIVQNDIKFISERDYVSEDIPFQIDFLKHCNRISFIPDIMYFYCYNQGSLTKSFNIGKFDKVKALYKLLSQKVMGCQNGELRVKRLFIGYIRAMLRLIVSTPINKKLKKEYFKHIINDQIWNEIKNDYKLSYLPIHQHIMLWCIYNKFYTSAYIYAKLLNNKTLSFFKMLLKLH